MNEYLAIKPLPIRRIILGRAWRIECEGALYHLMFQGNNEQDIYLKNLLSLFKLILINTFSQND
jgi:hypothetical protein